MRGRSPPRPFSDERARRLCGNISAPARRKRLATIAPDPRRSRHGTPLNRRDCGFRLWSAGTRCPRRAIVLLWCSAARSAFSCPLILSFFGSMAYWLNIGHRLFPRDAMEDLPPRLNPFSPFPPDATFLPAQAPGFPLIGPARAVQLILLLGLALPGGPLTPPGPPSRGDRQPPSTHPPHAARSSPANPFLESPADFVTRAPNLTKLGQASRARQELVRNSE